MNPSNQANPEIEPKKAEDARMAGGYPLDEFNRTQLTDIWSEDKGDYFSQECVDVPFGD